MIKLLLSMEIYSERGIKETCDVYKNFADIEIMRKDDYVELAFNNCKYDPSTTAKEFENYLINVES